MPYPEGLPAVILLRNAVTGEWDEYDTYKYLEVVEAAGGTVVVGDDSLTVYSSRGNQVAVFFQADTGWLHHDH